MTDPITDTLHFSTLREPLCPNATEFEIYKQLISENSVNTSCNNDDSVLLLGFTKKLLLLCTHFIDVSDPPAHYSINTSNKTFIKDDWFNINGYYKTIIGDGVLNLAGGELVSHLSDKCDMLIIRFFTEKIDGMKYATNFRLNTPFLLPDKVIDTQASCKILVWTFNHKKTTE